jgi:hypothetical protein
MISCFGSLSEALFLLASLLSDWSELDIFRLI